MGLVLDMDFESGVEQLKHCFSEETTDFLKLRWLVRYQDQESFTDFERRFKAVDIPTQEEVMDILSDLKKLF